MFLSHPPSRSPPSASPFPFSKLCQLQWVSGRRWHFSFLLSLTFPKLQKFCKVRRGTGRKAVCLNNSVGVCALKFSVCFLLIWNQTWKKTLLTQKCMCWALGVGETWWNQKHYSPGFSSREEHEKVLLFPLALLPEVQMSIISVVSAGFSMHWQQTGRVIKCEKITWN